MVQKQEDNIAQVDVFHAISDRTRRGLLDLVANGEQSVKTLAQAFTMSQPAISQYLRILTAYQISEKCLHEKHTMGKPHVDTAVSPVLRLTMSKCT